MSLLCLSTQAKKKAIGSSSLYCCFCIVVMAVYIPPPTVQVNVCKSYRVSRIGAITFVHVSLCRSEFFFDVIGTSLVVCLFTLPLYWSDSIESKSQGFWVYFSWNVRDWQGVCEKYVQVHWCWIESPYLCKSKKRIRRYVDVKKWG